MGEGPWVKWVGEEQWVKWAGEEQWAKWVEEELWVKWVVAEPSMQRRGVTCRLMGPDCKTTAPLARGPTEARLKWGQIRASRSLVLLNF